ncbi:TrmH family RNA methyltransferase [Nesterenkonia ebinurensis]|uniref:TrmH family RNA methyltransferase n=1 Tax=Nesterenkonia ebinurensis TaxID=2608252 RepID=UPI001CC79989|nr:TrmH family RNA methyltransferase [Nesterenkonia ebinurensis]
MSDEFVVDNPRSERVKRVAQLATRAGRRKQGKFLAEGPQPVREALRLWLRTWESPDVNAASQQRIPAQYAPQEYLPALEALYFDPAALERHPGVASLLDQVRGTLFDPQRELPPEARLFLREATEEVLAAMGDAETSQGILAVCRPPAIQFEGLDSLLVGMRETTVWAAEDGTSTAGTIVDYAPVRLAPVLVRLQDPGNVGTLIRVADAAGAGVVVLTPGSTDPWAPKVVRAAAGSHFHIPVATGIDLDQLTTFVRENGAQVLAADGYAATSLAELQLQEESSASLLHPTYWLLGNEAHGLSDHEGALADYGVAIPLYGQAESLNVALAGALCLYASAIAQRSAPEAQVPQTLPPTGHEEYAPLSALTEHPFERGGTR